VVNTCFIAGDGVVKGFCGTEEGVVDVVTLTLLLVFLDHGEPLLCIILQLLKDTI
jgi:hypothetical protein